MRPDGKQFPPSHIRVCSAYKTGRRIHHHEPQHRCHLHQNPAVLDHCRPSDMSKNRCHLLPAAPTRVTGGQQVCECRQVPQVISGDLGVPGRKSDQLSNLACPSRSKLVHWYE